MTEYNKVVYDGQTLIDLTNDDVTESDVLAGVYFHKADGTRSVGTLNVVDYVVEQGTDGIWTYRKWNSGIAECWGEDTKTTALTTAWGNLYRSGDLIINFPSGVFNAAPTSISIFIVGSNSVMIMNTGVAPTSAQTRVNLVRSSSASSSSYKIQVRAIGKWK